MFCIGYCKNIFFQRQIHFLECYYHFQIITFGLPPGFLQYVKYFFDFFVIFYLLINYYLGSNYYDDGYFIDNFSISNLMNSQREEYCILFLAPFYNFEMYYLIQVLIEPTPGKIFRQRRESSDFRICIYFSLYIFFSLISIIFLCLYTLFLFVPKNNRFSLYFSDKVSDHLSIFFPGILSFFTTICLPFLLKKMYISSKIEAFITILINTLFTIVLPFLLTFIFSNDCMNLWVQFWEPCYKNLSQSNQENTFDIFQDTMPYEQILHDSDVCDANWTSIRRNGRCIRTVFRTLIDLTVQKLCFSCFIFPTLQIFIEFIKFYFPCFSKKATFSYNSYTILFTYVEYLILFGFVCPLIIPMIYVAVIFHGFLIIATKELFSVNHISADYKHSIKILYFTLFFNNILIIFVWHFNGFIDPISKKAPVFLILVFTIFWSCIIWYEKWFMKEKDDDVIYSSTSEISLSYLKIPLTHHLSTSSIRTDMTFRL